MIAAFTNHLWQSTLFVLAAALVAAALRRNGAYIRHRVWLVASLKFLVPFSLLLSLGSVLPRFAPAAPAAVAAQSAPNLSVTVGRIVQPFGSDVFNTAAAPASAVTTTNWPAVVLGLWACGFVAVMGLRVREWRRVRAAVRASVRVVSGGLKPAGYELAGYELHRVSIEIRSSPGLLEPGIVGVFRPVLLVPAGIEAQLTPAQMQAVLAHEHCHVARRDNLTSAMHMVVEAVFWFHPLVWWVGARLVEERERACDEHVLRVCGEPEAYAESILNVCKLYVESPLACVAGVTGAGLKKRIAAIMGNRIGRQLSPEQRITLTAAACLAIALPLAAGMLTAPLRASSFTGAQSAAEPAGQGAQARFEVVSVKPCDPNARWTNRGPAAPAGFRRGGAPWQAYVSPGYVYWDCVTLSQLVDQAYVDQDHPLLNIVDRPRQTATLNQPKRVRGGPDWVEQDKWAIEAKAPLDVTTPGLTSGSSRYLPVLPQAMSQALRAVLEDRFKAKVHRATEQQDLYALTVATGGLNTKTMVKPTPGDCMTVAQVLGGGGGRRERGLDQAVRSRVRVEGWHGVQQLHAAAARARPVDPAGSLRSRPDRGRGPVQLLDQAGARRSGGRRLFVLESARRARFEARTDQGTGRVPRHRSRRAADAGRPGAAARPGSRESVKLVVAAVVIAGVFATPALQAFRASDLTGRVVFNDAGVPGATVTANRSGRTVSTVTDEDGAFRLAALEDGAWTVKVEMPGFVPMSLSVTMPPTGPPLEITLALRRYDDMAAELVKAPAALAAPPDDLVKAEDDPDIINGSSINGAASVFAQARAFGNNRPRVNPIYTGALNAVLGNSAWNARPFSFGDAARPDPSYGDVQLGVGVTGPLKIPWLVTYGPQTTVGYQHGVQHNATTQSAFMPTLAERAGDFSGFAGVVRDPLTGLPFPGNRIPLSRISPQAAALLAYYPPPNTTADGANFQAPLVSRTTRDHVQTSMSRSMTRTTTLGGTFAFDRTLTDSTNLFGFSDRSRQSSINAGLTWRRTFSTRLQVRVQYAFTRMSTTVSPFFAGRTNVSGEAGIMGNSQDAVDWGPPTLSFPDVAGLNDVEYERSAARSHAGGAEVSLRSGRHDLTFGGDVRWNHDDVSSQPDPRGTLSFTGAATGNAFADFLLGLPTTSAIAFGNTDARLRGASYDAYLKDDFRIAAGLTVNLGVRWEYEAPVTEASGRLVNLDVAPDFAATEPVLASRPTGPLTGTRYPASFVRPDRLGLEPRLAASWRPSLGSSLVIRASYGLYRNLGVYQPLALLLAQQPPFSKTLSVESTPDAPLALDNPFPSALSNTNTFAVDPDFRPGGVQQWQVSAQRDLPGSLTVLASYDGAKGRHLMQAFLPNTYPAGADNPCPACHAGFVYVTSNGSSLRHTAQFTLRRRLHSGLTASVQYTLSKSTDDAATFSSRTIAPGSLAVAQDWLDLGAERGPSSFDQRHVVAVQVQYTTGQGIAGGTLIDGLWGRLFKDWTITGDLTRGSGLPFTPVSFAAVGGTGIVGVRPALTGVSPAPVAPGSFANAAAYAAPPDGQWGNAGRNSIRGPSQFSLDATVARVFRLHGRMNVECRVAVTNLLNHVTFSRIDTVITSPQFGLPTSANAMRRLQISMRLGF